MVLPGQYLERPALVPCGDLVLEGLSHRGARPPALLICPPVGAGGGMDAPVVAELAWATARAGHASLRFQHRGVGASQGEPDAARALEDALAALDHLEATSRAPLALAGVGSGCATALAVAAARPGRLVALALIAPEAPPRFGASGPRALLVLPERGGLARRRAEARLPSGARVEVLTGADATFRGGLTAVGRAVVAWLAAAP